jgi:hypothetical protein
MVIARVGQVIRKLAADGELAQHRPEDDKEGRVTCRYSIRATGDA